MSECVRGCAGRCMGKRVLFSAFFGPLAALPSFYLVVSLNLARPRSANTKLRLDEQTGVRPVLLWLGGVGGGWGVSAEQTRQGLEPLVDSSMDLARVGWGNNGVKEGF